MTRALRAFRRSPLLLRLLSAALLGALLLHGSAPAVEAQVLEKPEAAQIVRLHLGAYLFWHESSGADGYEIQTRSQSGGTWGNWSSISYTGTTQPATVTGLTAGTKYQWRIRATSGSEQSEWSGHDDVNDLAYNWTAESLGRNIANPAVLQSAEPADPGEVTVTWTHGPARSGVTITGWTVGYRLFSEPVNQTRETSRLPASATMATVTGLTGGEQYEFWVRPYVGDDPGRTSNALEATPTATPVPTQSSDATLRALSVSAGSVSPAFSSTTYAYTVSVAAGVTSTTVTPTVNHSAATVTVNETTVASGSPSGPIALNVGDNDITVRVTAENGDTQDYTVTVTRQSRNANLSALSASAATSESATYSRQTLAPAFAVGTRAYSVRVEPDFTHARVTPTVEDTNATVQVGKRGTTLATVASGTDSDPIALERGDNEIIVRVTAEDTSITQDYTVTITRQSRNVVDGRPPAPAGLTVTPGPHSLSVTWTAPAVSVEGYDVHYTTMSADDLADDAAIGAYKHPSGRYSLPENRYPYLGWVRLSHGYLAEPKYGVGYLYPGQEYRFRVRAYNSHGVGPWAVGKGTPKEAARTVSLSASAERVREGDPVTITATVMYEGRPSPIQEDLDILLTTHLGTAEAGDVDELGRISIGKYTDRASATIQTHRDGDGDDEKFAVLIRSIPKRSLARAGDPHIVWVTITEGDPAPPEPVVLVPELQASGGDGALHLSWNDSSSEHSGYDVAYKRSSAADRPATTAGDPATGWVDAGHTGLERSMTITGLTNRVSYDARVRLAFPDGSGRWALTSPTVPMPTREQGQSPTVSGSGDTPPEQEAAALPTAVTLSLDAATVGESAGTVTVTATLDAPAPDGGIGGFLFAGADGTASEGIDFTMPLEIFIPGGQRSATDSITITDDDLDEADETAVISALFDLGTAVLEDTITLTISDDDTAGVTVSAASPLAVDEGATATYTVVLDSQPTADVTITATSSDTGAVSVSPASHTFTSSTWSTPVTFTVRGVADADTNDETVSVSHGVTSDDAKYAAALAGAVSVSVSDTTQEQQHQQEQANQPPTVAEGTATITVTAEDSGGDRVSDAFDVTVAAPQSTLSGSAAPYDANGDGAIDGSEYQQVKNDWLSGKINYDEFLEVVRVHLSSG